jgi:sulfotransferase family protein
MNPFVFIVGCPRSGTTLLKRLVDAHPEIAITPESHWIPRFYQARKGLTADGLVTAEFVPLLLRHHRFADLQISRAQLESLTASGRPLHYSAAVTAIFDWYGKARGKSLVGDKTPGYVRGIGLLHELWPDARFVHLVRDGRDVFLSLVSWPKVSAGPGRLEIWREDRATSAALWWEWHVRLGRAAGRALAPDRYYEMRYEALCADPAAQCAAVCDFLRLPYEGAMLRFHEGRRTDSPGLDAKAAWLPVTPGLRDWRTQMQAEDVERFEAAAGGLLRELGYPLAFPHPRPEVIAHAGSLRERFSHQPPTHWQGETGHPLFSVLDFIGRQPG